MSLASNIHELLMGGSTATYSYTINNSLRIRRSATAYLSRTPATTTNQTTFTFSFWFKISTQGNGRIYVGRTGSNFPAFGISAGISGGSALTIDQYGPGAAIQLNLVTSQIFRDPSSWYHAVIAFDTTQATASNRVKVYVNGSQVTSFSTSTYPSQNQTINVNTTNTQYIGSDPANTGYFDGYLSEFIFIDGQALDASYFGATNSITGIWAPKRYSGSYGTNGFYLPFSDTSGLTSGSNTGIGKDFSGNGNYWTTNNISLTAGSTYDAMLDSPTPNSTTVGNYCVLNPLTPVVGNAPINANLTESSSSATAYSSARSTFGLSSGKWYWEQTIDTLTSTNAGVCQIDGGVCLATYNLGAGMSGTGVWGFQNSNGSGTNSWKFDNGNTTNTYTVIGSGDVVGLALDMDAGTLGVYRNNTLLFTCNTSLSGNVVFPFNTVYTATGQTATASMNFGQRPFTYTPPTGYSRVQTYNLPTPAIKKGNQHFDATLWTGNGTSQTITNSGGFAPDFVWAKLRSGIDNNRFANTIRGANKLLSSNLTDAENSALTTVITGFTSSGFTIGSDGSVNTNSSTYVGWQWKGGGTAVTNTNGSITSQVSANPTAGFSVVTYTGTGANGTIGHGLGVAPSMIIIKRLDAVGGWPVYHASFGNTGAGYLNGTGAWDAPTSAYWNNTSPSSTVFTVNNNAVNNASSGTYIAYCFAAIAGYSAFGSYTGNGSTDGPFVYCGFRPRYVLVKRTDASPYDWLVWDSSRNTYNVANALLQPDGTAAEVVGTDYVVDLLSNGFKIRSNTANAMNASGGTYVYACFAENPFQYSLAR